MKKISLIILLILSGCATLEEPLIPSLEPRKLTKEDQTQVGMTKSEVSEIMGEQLVTGYEKSADPLQPFVPIFLKNPYRAEVLRSDFKTFDVAYYFTAIKKPDGIISDDELTPFVFENDKLLGKGWYFLDKIKQENRSTFY